MKDPVNLAETFAKLERPYTPRILAHINDYKVQIAKARGPFVWHKHDDTDDFFLVIRGTLTIHLRDRDAVLREGELFVVPRGVEHCPEADEEAHVLVIEPDGTPHTGDTGGRARRLLAAKGELGQAVSRARQAPRPQNAARGGGAVVAWARAPTGSKRCMKLDTLVFTLALWLALASPALAKSTAYKAGYAFFFILLAAVIVFGLLRLVRLVRRR